MNKNSRRDKCFVALLVIGMILFLTGLGFLVASSMVNPLHPENSVFFIIGICIAAPTSGIGLVVFAIWNWNNPQVGRM